MRFKHINIVAENWKKLAEFYKKVFGCKLVPPERDLSGEWLERATSIPNAKIKGAHLKLPGYIDEGPTLEIFQYNISIERPKISTNRPGLAHIAFSVEDVESVKRAVLDAGGGIVGEVVRTYIPNVGQIEFAYMKDPEGNIIEIQCIK